MICKNCDVIALKGPCDIEMLKHAGYSLSSAKTLPEWDDSFKWYRVYTYDM